jgi:guanylate kinase
MILVGEITQFYCSEENESEKNNYILNYKNTRNKDKQDNICQRISDIEHEFNEETQQINDATNDALSQLSKSLQNEINKIDFNPLC